MDVVIVESPAKAKTINKYLGSNYSVIASYGHIRDLPAKNGSVRPQSDFEMDWAIEPKDEKHIKAIMSLVAKADKVYLATDPDREGEAISWHILQELTKRKQLKDKTVKRVVFNEITKTAVTNGINNPRDIDMPLVNAYLARRALDYLVGFTLSPVLWRKLPGSRSAGRVQSVALRLVCERENEIEAFKAKEYWGIEADFLTPRNEMFTAKLTTLDGIKLNQFSLANKNDANEAIAKIKAQKPYHVGKIECKKDTKRNPSAPFTTSTLQQEASRKLYFSAKKTMQLAQQLYEGVDIGGETVGLITYMRTDGIQMAEEAINEARDVIKEEYGDKYLPNQPRHYKNNVKNAQEAHEAIRPTSLKRKPSLVQKYLNKDMFALYELVYKRALACQMESALIDKIGIDCVSKDEKIVFRATGQTITFDGFLKVYKEGIDDGDEEGNTILPPVKENENLEGKSIRPDQHFTQPPPRYSEASLVKKLEELGIGRPSTYASILSVLQERQYVRLDKRRFIPEDRGRIVTVFLENFFEKYVQYDYTAGLENELDEVSAGSMNYKDLLRQFWTAFDSNVQQVEPLTITNIIDKLQEALADHLFPKPEDKICPECGKTKGGVLSLKVGKFGAFIGCSNYPECKYTRQFGNQETETNSETSEENVPIVDSEARLLGVDEKTGKEIYVKNGPYGHYVQLGNDQEKDKKSILRTSLPKNLDAKAITFEDAQKLLSLPKVLGVNPENNEEITLGIGKFGPYLKVGKAFKSVPNTENILLIDLNKALEIISNSKSVATETIGEHPRDKQPITTGSGRFGPYIKYGKLYVSIPKSILNENRLPSLQEALGLIQQKEAKVGVSEPEKTKKVTKKKSSTQKEKKAKVAKTATKAKKK
ncbi:MAG: type I DNA topoisomerase [Alphaproteobacteria bacterium]|nr:type I DNA topoisomerase [Alphaproteobacteria bacterium]